MGGLGGGGDGGGGLGGLGGLLNGFGKEGDRSKRHLESEEDYEERLLVESLKSRLGITEEDERDGNVTEILKERYASLPTREQYRLGLWFRALHQRRQMRLRRQQEYQIMAGNQTGSGFKVEVTLHTQNGQDNKTTDTKNEPESHNGNLDKLIWANSDEKHPDTKTALSSEKEVLNENHVGMIPIEVQHATTSHGLAPNQTSEKHPNVLEPPTTWTSPTIDLKSDAGNSKTTTTTTTTTAEMITTTTTATTTSATATATTAKKVSQNATTSPVQTMETKEIDATESATEKVVSMTNRPDLATSPPPEISTTIITATP